jgi:hypothetical protein
MAVRSCTALYEMTTQRAVVGGRWKYIPVRRFRLFVEEGLNCGIK